MLIVSDTGPLRYLIETDLIEVLPHLYGSIHTTPAVIAELALPHFPSAVRLWTAQPPVWLIVEVLGRLDFLDQLDMGEASALSLAVELHADVVLIDERNGTRVARSNGLSTIGTLAVLVEAGLAGFVDFHLAIRRLTEETRFRYSRAIVDQVIADFEQANRQKDGPR